MSGYRKSYAKYRARQPAQRPRGRVVKYSKTKKMVTGHGPTLLEQISSGVGSVAKLAGAVAPIIAAINTEEKYLDQAATVTAYNPGTNDQVVCLTNNILQGVNDNERVGNSILAKNLNVSGHVYYASDATHVIAATRIVLFVWKDNANANSPTAAKLFETPTNILSRFNKDYTDQFVVLKDKYILHNATTATSNSSAIQRFKFYHPLDFHIRWLNTTTGGTQNHVYLAVQGSHTASANASTISYYARLNYTDN